MFTHQFDAVDRRHRLQRARVSLEGLSLGDAFGRNFFYTSNTEWLIASRAFPAPPWPYTDDTAMALSIYETLACHGTIERDDLAGRFAKRFKEEIVGRGYGPTAAEILEEIASGTPWQHAAASAFGGQGSMGNGSAMRVGPVGAFFADDRDETIRQATASAEVTHAHADGQAGAIAIALAASYAWQTARDRVPPSLEGLIDYVLSGTPDGPTAHGVRRARAVPMDTDPVDAAGILGNGTRVICSDTVPFCLWCAARHIDSFEDAMWATLSGLGDRDTTCAIVGSIVALAVGEAGLPASWITAREPLNLE